MGKSLVVVESPAKAKTIGRYLGKDYVVKASLGHVKDLPKNELAVTSITALLPSTRSSRANERFYKSSSAQQRRQKQST